MGRKIPDFYVGSNFTGAASATVFAAGTNTKGAWIEHVGIKINGSAACYAGIRDITAPNLDIFGIGHHNSTPLAIVAPDRIFVPAGVGVQAYCSGSISDAHVTVGYTLLT